MIATAAGCCCKLEEAVRGDAQLGAGYRRDDGLAAGGDDACVGAVALTVHLHRVRVHKARMTFDAVNALLLRVAVPVAVDIGDVRSRPLPAFASRSCRAGRDAETAASSTAWASWAAYHMTFLGTQPLLTQVPPDGRPR